MKLHTLSLSPNGRKVHALINYLGIDAEIHEVDVRSGEQKSEAFLAMNPNGKVPVLDDDGFFVWESNAIVTYLGGKYADKNLLPADLKGRSQVDCWLHWQNSHFSPPLQTFFTELLLKKLFNLGDPDQALLEKAKGDFATYCAVLDKQLAGKEFVCGKLSVVDFAIGTWAESAPAFGLAYTDYPNISAWLERVTSLEGWVKHNHPQLG